MIYYKNADYNLIPKLVKRSGKYYDDNIYSFDIETTSIIYNNETGKSFLYDKSFEPDYYEKMEKYGYMYIWQFSINDMVVGDNSGADVELNGETVKLRLEKV